MKDKIVLILPDHDAPGEHYAAAVADLCYAAGAEEVRIVRLAEQWQLPPGGDLIDVLAVEDGNAESVLAKIDALASATAPLVFELDEVPNVELPAYDAAALFPEGTEPIHDFFEDLARSTQTPPEMAALLGLAIVSACLCNIASVRGHGDHTEPAPLWALVLSDPGTRKSAVLMELLRPVTLWEKRQAQEMQPTIAAAKQRHRMAEKRIKDIEDRAAKEPDHFKRAGMEADAIELAQQLQSDRIPVAPALLACEPTPEALLRQMSENHGRALLASAEGDALDIIQGRYSGVRNYGVLLKGHAGDPIRSPRIHRPADVIDRPALAVALCIQRAAVEAVWIDPQAEGRGLLARFAVIAPPDLVGKRDVRPDPVRESAREAWQQVIARLLSFTPADDPEVEPVVIGLSAEADTVYHQFQIRIEHALGFGDLADRRAWGGKLCGLALRIALALHAIQTWGIEGTPEEAPPINAKTMTAAIAWADYLAASERHARASITEPAEERQLRRHVELIDRRGGAVSAREWQRCRSLKRVQDANAELDELVEAGYGEWKWMAAGPRGGRPCERFVLRRDATTSDESPSKAHAIAAPGP